jgi:hypothetical protein
VGWKVENLCRPGNPAAKNFFVYCFLSFSWVLARLCGNGKRPQIHFGQARATYIVHAEVCWNHHSKSKTTYKKRMCAPEANKLKTAFDHLCIFVCGHGFPVSWAWQSPFHRARPLFGLCFASVRMPTDLSPVNPPNLHGLPELLLPPHF